MCNPRIHARQFDNQHFSRGTPRQCPSGSAATNLRLWALHLHQPQCKPSHIIPRLISSHLQWKREESPKSSTSSMGSASPPSCQTWIGRGSWSYSAKPRPICWGMSASNLAGQNKLSLTCIVQGLEFQALVQGLEFQALELRLWNHSILIQFMNHLIEGLQAKACCPESGNAKALAHVAMFPLPSQPESHDQHP